MVRATNERSDWNQSGTRAAAEAHSPSRFIKQHVAPLLYRWGHRVARAVQRDKVILNEEDFWRVAQRLTLTTVTLREFQIQDWFPRAPGVYWSDHGARARDHAYASGDIDDPELGRIVRPRSKMDLVEEGGLGTVRLLPRRIEGDDYWFCSAVTGAHGAGGVAIAVPAEIVARGAFAWGDIVSIRGKVRPLDDVGLKDPAHAVHHASPMLVVADEIKRAPRSRQVARPLLLTPVVLFSNGDDVQVPPQEHDWGGDFGYTFVHVPAGQSVDMDRAEDWLHLYAKKHGGRIVTNFDQQRPFLADAPLSYQRLVQRTYDRTIIENLYFGGTKLAERIDRVGEIMSVNVTLGDGSVVHGDLIVANSVRDSFNRATQITDNTAVSELLQQLTSQVGRLLENLKPEVAREAADALETLTKEAARTKPRREWWELSAKGLKEAAATVKAMGKPVIETVNALLPLLTDLSQ